MVPPQQQHHVQNHNQPDRQPDHSNRQFQSPDRRRARTDRPQPPGSIRTGRITLETAPTSGQNFSIEVGNCSGGNFTGSGSDTINGDGNTGIDFQITADSFSISTDDYLAANITHHTDLKVKTGGAHSHITAPDNAPAYPVPELLSVLFVSIALIARAGVLLINSRRSEEK